MYESLLPVHSSLRYLVLLLLVAVIIKSLMGFSGKKPFGKTDNILGLTLFSVTHTQLLVGLILYFISPFVKFSGEGMKDPSVRYWTTEHIVMMIAAIALITVARTTSKKMADSAAKHKRMLIFNTLALTVIIVALVMSKRGVI